MPRLSGVLFALEMAMCFVATRIQINKMPAGGVTAPEVPEFIVLNQGRKMTIRWGTGGSNYDFTVAAPRLALWTADWWFFEVSSWSDRRCIEFRIQEPDPEKISPCINGVNENRCTSTSTRSEWRKYNFIELRINLAYRTPSTSALYNQATRNRSRKVSHPWEKETLNRQEMAHAVAPLERATLSRR